MHVLKIIAVGIVFTLSLISVGCSNEPKLDDKIVKTAEIFCENASKNYKKNECLREVLSSVRGIYKLLEYENELLKIKKRQNKILLPSHQRPLNKLQPETTSLINLTNRSFGYRFSIIKSDGIWVLNY